MQSSTRCPSGELARPAIPRDEGVYPARVARIGGPVPLEYRLLALVRLVEHDRHPLRVVGLGRRRSWTSPGRLTPSTTKSGASLPSITAAASRAR